MCNTIKVLNTAKKATAANIKDRVKSFEDACDVLGVAPEEGLELTATSSVVAPELKAIAAFAQLVIITKALNEGWTPDWNNKNQPKYFPWFEWNKPSSGFSLYHVYDSYSATYASSRLCFRTSELARYAAEQFKELYNDYLKPNA